MQEKHGLEMTKDELIAEAKLQTEAIQRLSIWLRLGYSLVAVGFILGLWGMQNDVLPGIIGGVVCLVVGAPLAIVLRVGTGRARKNVERILEAAGVDLEETAQKK